MITPAYSPTATERVLPRLALDFTTAVLDPRVTVTRALNTATVTNADGSVTIVNADLPRFDYANGVCKGLLIEETRANLLINSILSGAVAGTPGTAPTSWFFLISTGQIKSVSASAYAAGNKITFLASNQRIGLSQNYTLAANTTYVLSAWIDVVSGTRPVAQYLYFASPPAGSTFTYYIDGVVNSGNVPSGRHFIQTVLAVAATGGVASPSFGIGIAGNSTAEVSIEMPQLEIGAFATSYIPTTTTSLTRNADDVSMTGTNFSDWYVSSSAALAAVVVPSVATGTRPIWQFDDTTTNEIIALRGNVANPELYIVDNGALQAQLDAGTIAANTQYGLCAAFTTNSCAVSQNGATPVTTATATMPTVTQARIGSDGSNFLNGAVRTLRYWPQRILNAETQAFSK